MKGEVTRRFLHCDGQIASRVACSSMMNEKDGVCEKVRMRESLKGKQDAAHNGFYIGGIPTYNNKYNTF